MTETDGVEVAIRRRDKLFRQVRQLSPEIERELLKAIMKGAEEIAETARALAPVDSGELRDSIHTELDRHKYAPAGRVIADAPHARWVEFGTLGGVLGAQPPRPYMWPAYRLLKKRVQGRISRAVTKAAKKVAK